jgi:cytochrome c-type biogenesis protein CcmH/NrfF
MLTALIAGALAWAGAARIQLPAAAAPQSTPAEQRRVDSLLEARTSEVAAQLRCPVCQGLSIQESPSELSTQMRALVKEQLRDGRSPDEVKAYFVSKYGEWILLEPRPRGFNLLVYALPVAVVIGGAAVIAVGVRRWTQPLEPRT